MTGQPHWSVRDRLLTSRPPGPESDNIAGPGNEPSSDRTSASPPKTFSEPWPKMALEALVADHEQVGRPDDLGRRHNLDGESIDGRRAQTSEASGRRQRPGPGASCVVRLVAFGPVRRALRWALPPASRPVRPVRAARPEVGRSAFGYPVGLRLSLGFRWLSGRVPRSPPLRDGGPRDGTLVPSPADDIASKRARKRSGGAPARSEAGSREDGWGRLRSVRPGPFTREFDRGRPVPDRLSALAGIAGYCRPVAVGITRSGLRTRVVPGLDVIRDLVARPMGSIVVFVS